VKKSGKSLADEFDFTTQKIEQNFSNYSSWHYRSSLLPVLFEGESLRKKLDSGQPFT
jgi:geranylgeranyl transferase type-2 subunit alpha